ncbi:hypothetical protein ASC82_03475 [Streptomyces sp. Root431]|uniref:hypothetical protein n=1 Tax=Streptomyces sp. Root431 TaxID=1736535 RepID=UPI0006F994BB|nr:hypothetical protein [Streptomyces sp. Root431]KQX17275.1 hypothetical protein ASC82_03475 [Streptomyces sp. Root431]
MSVTSGWVGRSAVVLAVVLSAAACGGGDSPEPNATDAVSPTALKTCEDVFGKANVEAVRADLGDAFRPYDRSLAEMKDRMAAEARGWTAGKDDLKRTTYHPCEMEGGGDGATARVTGTVGWSMYDIAFLGSGEGRQRWRAVADGVYVASRADAWGMPLVMACTIPGTAAGQGRELPLQVAVNDAARKSGSGDAAVSTEQLLKSLAESTRTLLGCEEKTAVPDDLLP